ncbi:MAG: YkvA family protein [Polyangiaceae bacterium]
MSITAVRRVGYAKALLRYFKDSQASFLGKLFVLLSVAYVVMPLDAIPDVAPVIGWLDDLGVVAVASLFLTRKLGKYRDEGAELEAVPVRIQRARLR